MRDSTKVIIGFGSILGLYAFGAGCLGLLISGAGMPVAGFLYCFTFLPACLLAIWFKRSAAIWLLLLALITGIAFGKELLRLAPDIGFAEIPRSIIVTGLPGLFGFLLLRTKHD